MFRPNPKHTKKIKTCSHPGCGRDASVKGKCKAHYWSEKRSASAKKAIFKNQSRYDGLLEWYKGIHHQFQNRCQETGHTLRFDKKHAAHLLPKSQYQEFELDLRNGILVTLEIHAIIDKGTVNQRKKLKVWNFIQKRRKKLLESVGKEFDEKYWENMTV